MPVAFFLEAIIRKPLINQSHQGIDTAQTDCCFFVGELFYSLGVTATPFRMHLADMIALVLLCVLFVFLDISLDLVAVNLVLPISLQKSQNRNNSTRDVEEVQA